MSGFVAVLVDADNLAARHGRRLIAEAERLGQPVILRAYGDAQRGAGWLAEGFRLLHAGSGKNAADLLLAIEAMEMVHRQALRAFVIGGSDGDQIHLAQRLRETGATVVGAGKAKTPQAYRAACSRFVLLPEADLRKSAAEGLPGPAGMEGQALDLIRAAGGEIAVTALAGQMRARHQTQIGATAEGTWRKWLGARAALFDLDPKGPEARVRSKRAA